jgi:membrane protease YdiL (CAAX protease family)
MIDFSLNIFFSLLLGFILHWGALFAGFFTRPLGFTTTPREKILSSLYFTTFFIGYSLFPTMVYSLFNFLIKGVTPVLLFAICSTFSLLILAAICLSAYYSIYERERKNWFHVKDLLMSLLTYALAFPSVNFISQCLLLFIYLVFGTLGEDQTAVRYLKLSLETPPSFCFIIFSVCVFAPIIEEILFRGFLHRILRSFFSFIPAALISSILFSLVHFSLSQGLGNIPLLASLTILSIYISYLYERQGRIFPCIILHALFNLISTIHIMNL